MSVESKSERIGSTAVTTSWQEYIKERSTIDMARPNRAEICLHEFVEHHATVRPDRIAVVDGDRQVTYCELDSRSSQLERYLRSLGVGPEIRVGVCLPRSLDMILAFLAVLKAGGAYVAADTRFPRERIAYMFNDASVPLILTHTTEESKVPAAISLVFLDTENPALCLESRRPPEVEVTSEDIAHVIYTSGSTGRPKAGMIPHRSVVGFAFGVNYLDLNEDNTFLHHSSVAWDAVTLEVWLAFVAGARCVIYCGQPLEPIQLSQEVKKHQVTFLWLTASLFNVVVEVALGGLSFVRYLVTGSEPVSVSHVSRALENLPNTMVVNGYGPSECGVFSTCYAMSSANGKSPSVPIGKPIGDRRGHLVNANFQCVPEGVTGEICIGGRGVGRGYLNEPALTAESFVPDPFSDLAGSRLYRTGDLGRWMRDGNIEFVGRADNQVKIRGFRTELGEIETALLALPGVMQAVVVAREDQPGEKKLAGYVVPAAGKALNAAAISLELSQKLPDYMVPTALVVLKDLPLTGTGKVDRRALPP